MQLKDVLEKTTAFFKEKGIPSARLDTELLLAQALNWERIRLYMNYEYPLSSFELEACRSLVRRRAQGEPIAYILGRRDFYKSTFVIEPGVLIPRPETEVLVEEAVAWLRSLDRQNLKVIDMGCGSGCIGLSVLTEVSSVQVWALDASLKAVELTRKNAERLGVMDRLLVQQGKVEFVLSHAVEAEKRGFRIGEIDAVVANPPYIAVNDPSVEPWVRRFEPEEALFSDEDGLSHIRQWSSVAGELLRPGGFLIFEIGSGQGEAVREVFESDSRFESIEIVKDLAKHDRFVRCLKREG